MGQFHVKLENDWLSPDGAVVPATTPIIKHVLPLCQVAVGTAPPAVPEKLCSYVPVEVIVKVVALTPVRVGAAARFPPIRKNPLTAEVAPVMVRLFVATSSLALALILKLEVIVNGVVAAHVTPVVFDMVKKAKVAVALIVCGAVPLNSTERLFAVKVPELVQLPPILKSPPIVVDNANVFAAEITKLPVN